MKIIFDCRYTRLGRHDGISRYGARLVEELSKLHPVTMLISDERQLEMLPDLPWVMGTDPTSAREPWISRLVNPHAPDVVFTPMQTMGPGGRNYALVTFGYWTFTLTDGALRMLVLLHFNGLGFSPVQLAWLFLLYETAGIVTNLAAGWLAACNGRKWQRGQVGPSASSPG